MAPPLLEVTGLSKRFGGFVALDGIDLAVAAGERVGLIGPNGSGKSTLVNCICGTLVNETGTVRFAGEVVDGLVTHERTRRGMARSFQLPRPFVTLTVADNLRVPLLYTVNARRRPALRGTELDARCSELLTKIRRNRPIMSDAWVGKDGSSSGVSLITRSVRHWLSSTIGRIGGLADNPPSQ